MTAAFDTYRDAITKMEDAEKRATGIVAYINDELMPLRTGWKSCYLVGFGDVPSSLTVGGARKAVNIANVQARWASLQTAMTEYAEAETAAKQAHHAMPDSETRLLAPPPWLRGR